MLLTIEIKPKKSKEIFIMDETKKSKFKQFFETNKELIVLVSVAAIAYHFGVKRGTNISDNAVEHLCKEAIKSLEVANHG